MLPRDQIWDIILRKILSKIKQNPPSADPERAWRQLRTGYLKWVARYTADCPKERTEGAHSNILIEYFEKLKMLRNCIDFKLVPKSTKVHAKVQFIYGDGTNYR